MPEETKPPVVEAKPEYVGLVKKKRGRPTKIEMKEKLEKTFEHFTYSKDDISMEWEKENPLKVPDEIVKKYPQFEWRYRAKDDKVGLRKGMDYHGWQVFKDTAHPDGVFVGGDLVLCAMPRERAESYRKHVQNLSTEQVRGVQEAQIAALEKAGTDLRGAGLEVFQPGTTKTPGDNAIPEIGIQIGARNMPGKAPQYRGMHPEEIRERVARASEERSKNRTYSFGKR